jgi:hypothetical protein
LIGVGVASLFRWTKKPEPSKTRNKPATKIDREVLARDVEEKPDMNEPSDWGSVKAALAGH